MTHPVLKDQDTSDLACGVRVLETEAAGIKALAAGLDESFSRAVEAVAAIRKTPGARLIVAGIGKSGHIARKLAATLASTGTPAMFVHPGEASHGDLGMVTPNDIVLMLSYSGGNAELSDLIHYTRRFGITLISMTSNPDSPLARHADIRLMLPRAPEAPEACPNGLAPTTSTTMMLALGDALAVALLERAGLTPEQFKVFHPGGKLGRKLVTVRELMHTGENLPTLPDTAAMDQAILALSEKNLGCVLVLDSKGDLAGIVTDGDLKRHMAPNLLQKPVVTVMSRSPKTIEADQLAVEAMNVMTGTPGRYLTSLVVLEKGRLIGLIRLQDCLQAGLA
ncbi:MAG: KpsF/GutQ family sugar-phosphate isomerase [Rhodospirillales bacterium]|nr:KpsF/GutQ family sugar-phosphate isomerase [Rhodospirillales bacterium]